MERIAVIAVLAAGSRERAEQLLAEGPPFELAEAGFSRHMVFLGNDYAVFVFEGENVAQHVSALADDPSAGAALGHWAPILDGTPRIAPEAFRWDRDEAENPT